MAKEPSAYELKRSWGLPDDAEMLGWLIHDHHRDEFLVKYTSTTELAGMWWGWNPDTAKAFKTLKKATSVLHSLDITGRAIVVPAFDVGKQIIVLTENTGVENPVAEFTRLTQEVKERP